MTSPDRPAFKPRQLREILDEMYATLDRIAPKPVPPPDAPTPPPSHHDRKENDL